MLSGDFMEPCVSVALSEWWHNGGASARSSVYSKMSELDLELLEAEEAQKEKPEVERRAVEGEDVSRSDEKRRDEEEKALKPIGPGDMVWASKTFVADGTPAVEVAEGTCGTISEINEFGHARIAFVGMENIVLVFKSKFRFLTKQAPTVASPTSPSMDVQEVNAAISKLSADELAAGKAIGIGSRVHHKTFRHFTAIVQEQSNDQIKVKFEQAPYNEGWHDVDDFELAQASSPEECQKQLGQQDREEPEKPKANMWQHKPFDGKPMSIRKDPRLFFC
jgi:hypothetical protein